MMILYIIGFVAVCFYWYHRGFRDGEREAEWRMRVVSHITPRDTIGN